jgi:hypothetical protein
LLRCVCFQDKTGDSAPRIRAHYDTRQVAAHITAHHVKPL